MSTVVSNVPALSSNEALSHFQNRLKYETDCWDTHHAMTKQVPDFILLDVRSPEMYKAGHIPGAINLPHGKITERTMTRFDQTKLFIVYCAGPHCNGANKAAINLARLGLPVKEMIGGICGWLDEEFSLEESSSS